MLLRVNTPQNWVQTALSDFDAFLVDHASCERKASAVGMSFVVRYPDRPEIIEPMIQFAREELEHFHAVVRIIQSRKLILQRDEEDEYVNQLMKAVRFGRDERFLDRLLVSALIEARGHERLAIVAEELKGTEFHGLYQRLAHAENGHAEFFLRLARLYFAEAIIDTRLEELLLVEERAILSVPHRSALH